MLSFTSSAYASCSPSLYTLIVYTTEFPVATFTTDLSIVYSASSFPSCNGAVFTFCNLEGVISFPSTADKNFFNAKSYFLLINTNFSKSSSSWMLLLSG